jgi:RNA polymerase sigma-70 factor (ECF subfamily)
MAMVQGSPRLVAPLAPDDRSAREAEIGRRLIAGDPGAAAALWDCFLPLVRGLLIRALGPSEIDDALQDVFLRIFRRGRALRDPTLVRSYVVAVTVHHIRSEFRRRRVRRVLRLSSGDEPEPRAAPMEGGGNPQAVLALRALYRALDALPTDERLAFTLRFFENVELPEGARLAGTSLATFKRRIAAAKLRLWSLTGEDPILAPYLAAEIEGSS